MSTLALITVLLATPATGHVQIKAPTGVVVELDSHGVSVAEGDEGAMFRDVSVGTHRVRAYRDNFQSVQSVLHVQPDAVTVLHLGPWIPMAAQRPTKGFGALIVQTFPVDATIKAARLGWDNVRKTDAPFVARRVPAGEHKLTFCNSYKCVDYQTPIKSEAVTSLFVDFDYGEVVDKSAVEAKEHAIRKQKCLKGKVKLQCKLACQRELALGKAGEACRALGQQESASLPSPVEVVPVSATRRLP